MIEPNADARILMVDDNVANLCLLQNILNRVGFKKLESLTDSSKTLERLARFEPDLIVLDLSMPAPDGFEVMQQLARVIPKDTFLPVLVLTADITAPTKRKALAAGASDLLTKPFDASEVFMRIRNLLQIRALQRQLQMHNQTLEAKVAARTLELRQSQQQIIAQQRLQAFGEMAGGIVHDFNNALMSVIGYSEILLNDDEMLRDTDIARHYLTIMNRAGQEASDVITRLRDFYRPREVTDVFARVNLNEILEQAVPSTQPKWKAQALADGRAISVQLDLVRIPPISGNAAELREVATHLIFNAADAIPGSGTITVRSGCDGRDVILEVRDTGTGMSNEVRERCLEPFFSTKGERGTGLGLSTVFGIVKRHEGSIEIESEIGEGTTFRIRFPKVPEPAAGLREAPPHLQPLRVLVVDDEPVSRGVLESYLTADGHEVVTASNAKDAIGCDERERFDLLITDHAMPGMNGLQLAALFRATRAGFPVILVTGFAAGENDPDAESAGVDHVMRKPVPRHELRRALRSVMGASQGVGIPCGDGTDSPAADHHLG